MYPSPSVAPHAGSVDRNSVGSCCLAAVRRVAPHAGSVDRNDLEKTLSTMTCVAPHAGSVDRNETSGGLVLNRHGSLPTRGAWIEISMSSTTRTNFTVSLPTRGAWIEIINRLYSSEWFASLPTRGAWIEIGNCLQSLFVLMGRSPRGERG